jgi:hypothetical protein
MNWEAINNLKRIGKINNPENYPLYNQCMYQPLYLFFPERLKEI